MLESTAEEEAPFIFVPSRRGRGARPFAQSSTSTTKNTSYSNASGSITGTGSSSAGFSYANSHQASSSSLSSREGGGKGGRRNRPKGASARIELSQEELQRRAIERAQEAIDVFVTYFQSAFPDWPSSSSQAVAHDDEVRSKHQLSYAESMREALGTVWPLSFASASSSATPVEQINAEENSEVQAEDAQRMPQQERSKGIEKRKREAVLPKRIVCLGLGSPTSSRAAQVQLALLILIRRWVQFVQAHREQDEATPVSTSQTSTTTLPGLRLESITTDAMTHETDAVVNEVAEAIDNTTISDDGVSRSKDAADDATANNDDDERCTAAAQQQQQGEAPSDHLESRQEEEGKRIQVYAYDPVFTSSDALLLAKYDIDIAHASCALASAGHDAAAATTAPCSAPPSIESLYTHPVVLPTLLYMPHCDRELYESVLSLAYPPPVEQDPQPQPVVLLSNMLSNYATFNSHLSTTSPTLARMIEAFAQPVHVPNWEGAKKSLLGQAETAGQVARLWDRNALRDLGFHWV